MSIFSEGKCLAIQPYIWSFRWTSPFRPHFTRHAFRQEVWSCITHGWKFSFPPPSIGIWLYYFVTRKPCHQPTSIKDFMWTSMSHPWHLWFPGSEHNLWQMFKYCSLSIPETWNHEPLLISLTQGSFSFTEGWLDAINLPRTDPHWKTLIYSLTIKGLTCLKVWHSRIDALCRLTKG